MSARARRALFAGLGLGALVLAACAPVAPPPPPPPPVATTGCEAVPGSTIPGQWVASVDPDGPSTLAIVPFDASTTAEKNAEVSRLDEHGTVLSVEPDRVVKALDVVTPGNDPQYVPKQQTALTEAGFPTAWTPAGFGGQGTTIAVVDTGVQANHEDLAGRVLQGADFVNGGGAAGTSNFGRIDGYGHGTHVAGIAAAADNAVGGIGGAPLAMILPVRVLNSCGTGSFSDVTAGITWAADHGANVISLSLGGGGRCLPGDALQLAIDHATNARALVVAAAGNSGSTSPIFPAGCTGVLAVGATQNFGASATRASFSNFGSYVGIAAPGSQIYSTFIPAPSTYTVLSGTSMATPFVSAAAALVYEHCLPSVTAAKVRDILTSTEGHIVPSMIAQQLSVYAASGTFTLTLNAETTASIPFDATAAQVKAALEALVAIGSGNVTVTGGPGTAGPYLVTLTGTAATNSAIAVNAAGLSGGIVNVTPLVVAPSGNSQTVKTFGSAGTFTLTFGGQTTAPIAIGATPAQVKAALEALPLSVVPPGTATVVTSAGGGGNGTAYAVTFTGAAAASATGLTSNATSITPYTNTATVQPFPGRLNAAAAVAASCT